MQRLAGLVAVVATAIAGAPAQALLFSSVHPYDDLENLQRVESHYEGYRYSPSAIVVCIPNPNFWLWPPAPESPRCIAGAERVTGEVTIEADITHGWRRATGYCMTSTFQTTYAVPITATGPVEQHDIVCRSPHYGRSAFAVECQTACFSLRFGPGFVIFDHLKFEALLTR